MKTDELLYELFKVEPKSIFRLVQLDLDGEYTFESVTFKTTEKRLDGFCQRIDGTGPNVFVEIQGYDDPKIYWRALREVCTYYEQNDATVPFVLIVLFLDNDFDPGDFPLSEVKPPHQFVKGTLMECFEHLRGAPGVLTVLKPLVTEKQEIVRYVQQWKADLQALSLSEETLHKVIELLEFAIRQRLPKLSEREVRTMLHLTPLEETVAGQELIQISRKKGRKEGIKEGERKGLNKGELIGEIRLAQKILKRPVSPLDELVPKSLKALKAILQELEADLAKLN